MKSLLPIVAVLFISTVSCAKKFYGLDLSDPVDDFTCL